MSIVHTQLAYWILRFIEQKSSLSSSAVNCSIGRGGGEGGLKHMLTVHPLMFRAVLFVVVLDKQLFLDAFERLIPRTM